MVIKNVYFLEQNQLANFTISRFLSSGVKFAIKNPIHIRHQSNNYGAVRYRELF